MLRHQPSFSDIKPSTASILVGRDLERTSNDARLGNHDAQLALAAHLLCKGDHIPARLWFTRASAKHASAMVQLGLLALHGQGGPLDEDEAARWFSKAGNLGSAQGMYNLSVCYQQGRGVDKNEDRALFWMSRAAEAGHDMAVRICEALDQAKIKAVDEYCTRNRLDSPEKLRIVNLSSSPCDSSVASDDGSVSSTTSSADSSPAGPRVVTRLPGVYFDSRRTWDRNAFTMGQSLCCLFF